MALPKRFIPTDNNILCSQWIDLLDELNIGAFTVNHKRQIMAINYSALALIDQEEKDVLGSDCREVFVGVPCTVKCLLCQPDGSDNSSPGPEPDVCVHDEDNRRHLLTRMATAIYDANHNIAGCLTILQDHSPIADLIDRIHYEEQSMKIILDSLDVGIFTINRGGYVTFFNREAEKLSGYKREDLLGTHYSVIFEEESPDESGKMMEFITADETSVSHRVQMTTKNGETLPMRTHYMALKNEKGNIVGGLATLHDLTVVRQLKQAICNQYTFHDMIGKDPAMLKLFNKVSVVADTDATVLIEGDTGTGKDLLAKVIHSASQRAAFPLVNLNCAAIPENLLESELFGYVQGAFTGAVGNKPGRFSEAHKGTIFLDEIGDMPLALQAKLLRVLENKEFYPLGSRRTRKVDVRIIAATNRALDQMVEKNLFRRDLFYRLNTFRFTLPALKDRRADIPLLIHHLLRKLCASHDRHRVNISESAIAILLNFDYPGNVRELENILEHALVICSGHTIDPRHLPDYVQECQSLPANQYPTHLVENESEKESIRRTLNQYHGHREKTAEALGMSRITLWRRMKQYGLD